MQSGVETQPPTNKEGQLNEAGKELIQESQTKPLLQSVIYKNRQHKNNFYSSLNLSTGWNVGMHLNIKDVCGYI
tara:strand:+ start:1671 stop:1892 length:222 start_codon:yes stop_codon:yes gene_type:complete